jgi:ribonuclease H2 subunit C
LPDGYHGLIAEKSQPKPEKREATPEDLDLVEVEQDDQPETGTLQGRAVFDEVVVWGHEELAESGTDPHVRSIEEWISFAEQVGHTKSNTSV